VVQATGPATTGREHPRHHRQHVRSHLDNLQPSM
jgi:hypothetical protein